MSLDYFDDEFMEGIPSIAPDLMFVEEANPTQQNIVKQEVKINTENTLIPEEPLLPEGPLREQLETIVEIESTETIHHDIITNPLHDLIKEEEATELEEPLIVLTPKEKEALLNFIIDDHAYARPYPEITSMKEENTAVYSPISSILKLHPKDFPPKKKYKKRGSKGKVVNEDDVDIMTVDKPDDMLVKYDVSRAKHVMNEVEAYLNSLWKDVEKDDEEKISRGSWSREQARFFDSVYGAISNYQLAKLTHTQNSNEPVLRKLALEKATKRVRKAFGSSMWNSKMVVWLHGVMIDGLCSSFFLCYLEILQALKRKVPSLFERVFLNDKRALEKEQSAGLSNLGARLRKSWEPSVGLHTKITMEKFPIAPFLITIPCGPSVPHQSTKRNRFWNYQLMNMGKSVPISAPAYRTPEGYVVKHYLEHCINTVRSKTSEFLTKFPDRPIVLVGWNVGAIIAMKVALLDKVDAVICLGFPCNHVEGDESQEYWEAFTKIQCPVLFVLGTHGVSNSVEKTEALRQKMKVHTNLIVMESGDELLRLTKSQKRSLGMSQNMIDKLIQDQLYIFLRDVLFKPKNAFQKLKESPSPRKTKKKIAGNLIDSVKEEGGKKRKKVKQYQLLTTSNDVSSSFTLPPLDVSVGLQSENIATLNNEGLLTTGSISTPIPVTQLQSENLLAPTSVSHQMVVSTETAVSATSGTPKIGQKRSSTSTKEKSVRKKVPKKTPKLQLSQQNFTANLGTQRAGNLFGQRFTTPLLNKAGNVPQTATLQRLPSGTYVLSGTSGHVRLQNGNNIVYLQQLTSSGGTTQVIQTPLIANPNGTFSTVPMASSSRQQGSSAAPTIPTSAILMQHSSLKTTTASASTDIATTTTVYSSLPLQTQPSNLVLAASLPSFQPKPAQPSPVTTILQSTKPQQLQLKDEPSTTSEASPETPSSSSSSSNPAVVGGPNLPSTLANLILSLPSSGSGGLSLEASAHAQNLLQKLSEEDIKTLTSLIGKYSSTPTSPAYVSPAMTPELARSPLHSPLLSSPSPTTAVEQSPTSEQVSEQHGSSSKSQILSLLDQKSTSSTNNGKVQSMKKISYPLSLTQKVTAIQQDINKVRSPRLKPPRIATSGLSSSSKSNITTITNANKALQTKTQKVPITITIPISRLPSSLQLTTSTSKTINVPALSAYLAQQKFVLSTGKSTSLDSRTVLLSPGNVKKMGGSIMVSTNSSKNPSVFTANKSAQKHGGSGKSSATITLHLPSQTLQKESSTLRKAASDIKLVGVLNQKAKATQLVNVPSFKPSSLPSSPILSPTVGSPSAGELSPIQPRKADDSSATSGGGYDAYGDAIKKSSEALEKPLADVTDESDIDFAVMPSVAKLNTSLHPQVSASSFAAPPTHQHFVNTSKIIRVPVSTGERNRLFSNKNLIEIAKAKISENQLMNSARKVGVAFQQKSAEAKTSDSKDSGEPSTSVLEGNKLRFEPLNLSGNRSNLSSVLSSMRETGKIIMDEHGQLRNTIVAKPTVVSSKTAAMIARTAFMTDTKFGQKSSALAFGSLSKPTISSKTTTPALFSGGKCNSNTSVISTPAATIRTATTNKVLPVTIKSNDFIRMSTQVRAQNNPSKQLPKIIRKEITTKSETKPKASRRLAAVEIKPEPREEPPPYITRSGRVLRTRFSFADELDRKPSPRKRRRTNSTSKEEGASVAAQPPPPVIPTPTPLGILGSSLDSLLEAAKLITTSEETAIVVDNALKLEKPSVTPATAESIPLAENPILKHIDSTTNLAANAMLELLSSDNKGIVSSAPTEFLQTQPAPPVDASVFVRNTNPLVQFIDDKTIPAAGNQTTVPVLTSVVGSPANFGSPFVNKQTLPEVFQQTSLVEKKNTEQFSEAQRVVQTLESSEQDEKSNVKVNVNASGSCEGTEEKTFIKGEGEGDSTSGNFQGEE